MIKRSSRHVLIWSTFAAVAIPLLFVYFTQIQTTLQARAQVITSQAALPMRSEFYELAHDLAAYRGARHLRADDPDMLAKAHNSLQRRIAAIQLTEDSFPSTKAEWEQWKLDYVNLLGEVKFGVFLAALDELIAIAELFTTESQIATSLTGEEYRFLGLSGQLSRLEERVAQVRGFALVEESEVRKVFLETMRWTIRHQQRFMAAEMATMVDERQTQQFMRIRAAIEELLSREEVDPKNFYSAATKVVNDLADFRQEIGEGFAVLLHKSQLDKEYQLFGLTALTLAGFAIAIAFSIWLTRLFNTQELLAQQLTEKDHLYRVAVDNAEVGVFDRPDVRSEDMYWSPRLLKLLKLPPEIKPKTLVALVHRDHRQVIEKLRSELMVTPNTAQLQAPLLCGDGKYRWFSVNASSSINPNTGSLRLSGTMINIDHVQQVELLRSNQAVLAKTVKKLSTANADLERFAHMASHDLQEPLRMVTSFMTLLREEYSDRLDEEAQEYIKFAYDGAARMQHLIDDLLEYAHSSIGDVEVVEVDLEEALQELCAEQSARIHDSGAQIIADQLPRLMADRIGLGCVLSNIVGNALKYARKGVKPQISIGAQISKEKQTLTISDNGIGIAAEHFNDIFVPFRRLHGSGEFEGTGVGLALVKNVVDSWQGDISVESEVGVGTTFTITWPLPESISLRGAA